MMIELKLLLLSSNNKKKKYFRLHTNRSHFEYEANNRNDEGIYLGSSISSAHQYCIRWDNGRPRRSRS